MMLTIHVEPVGAPRMTQSDKWRTPRRPCVVRYFEYRDRVRQSMGVVEMPESGASLTFYLPMPESWSKKKKAAMDGKPHQQKPDIDNLQKAFLDSVLSEDCRVWHLAGLAKYWSSHPRIELRTTGSECRVMDMDNERLERAMMDYYNARREHDKAFQEYCGHSWDYHGEPFITAMEDARKAFRAEFDAAVDARVAVVRRRKESPNE